MMDTSGDDETADTEDVSCDCCGNEIPSGRTLCCNCFWHPTAYADAVISREGLILEQASVLRSVARGENVFFTGSAGTGKSKVINAVQKYLRGLGALVSTIAPTGIAAVNVDGMTLHSFASWDASAGKWPLVDICKRTLGKKAWKKLINTDILIIDEISMIENNSLTRLSQMMQSAFTMRRDGSELLPFGGVQLVICGDFFQLAPVKPFQHCMFCGQEMENSHKGVRTCEQHGEVEMDDKFAFSSLAWTASQLKMTELKHIHRQTDAEFVSILQNLRKGCALTTTEQQTLLSHPIDIKRDLATKLTPKRSEAAQINDYHMRLLPSKALLLHARDDFKWRRELHPELEHLGLRTDETPAPLLALKDHRFPFEVELKRGMLVILTANIARADGLVNGAVGKLIDFVDMTDENMPRADNEAQSAERETFAGQIISGEHAVYQEREVRKFRDLQPKASRKWPIVMFNNGVKRVVFAKCLVTAVGKSMPFSKLSRTQIPLLPGWAITIHRSQGMTLDSAVVDLGTCWEAGQAYVALSRARSLSGLFVDTLPKDKMADPVVEQFMEESFERGADSEGVVGENTAAGAASEEAAAKHTMMEEVADSWSDKGGQEGNAYAVAAAAGAEQDGCDAAEVNHASDLESEWDEDDLALLDEVAEGIVTRKGEPTD